jgi:hypothetical protein
LDFPLGSPMFYVKRWISLRKETFNLTMVDVESDEAIPSIFCRMCEISVIVTSLNPGKWNISNFNRHLRASHLVVPEGKHFYIRTFLSFKWRSGSTIEPQGTPTLMLSGTNNHLSLKSSCSSPSVDMFSQSGIICSSTMIICAKT